jgi:alcohol dehydrogenase YqhD (iron-dependent ADH family)
MRGRHRTNFLEGSVKERGIQRQANNALKRMDLNLFIFNGLGGNPQNCWVFAPVSHSAEHAESVKILHVHFVVGNPQLDDFHRLSAVENFSGVKLFHHDAHDGEAQTANNCE